MDYSNYRVQVLDNNNKFLFKFGSKASNPGDSCYIALDSSDQVYVTDYSSGTVIVFSDDGHFIKINCDDPFAICLTPDDYIITTNGDILTVFSPTYQYKRKSNRRISITLILGIAVNSVGNIFVTEQYNRHLQVSTT